MITKKRILILLIVAPLVFLGLSQILTKNARAQFTRYYGGLEVDFRSLLPNQAIFNILNFLPGDLENHTVEAKNVGGSAIDVFVKGVKTGAPAQIDPKLESILDIEISTESESLYNNKLSQFFTESATGSGIPLGTLGVGQDKELVFKVSFPQESGNEYQNKKVIFDITFNHKGGKILGDHDQKPHPWPWFYNFWQWCTSVFNKFSKFR